MIRATYRLQFHKDFTFRDAAAHARYFAELGISHVYSSPILAARAGSRHGYDVIDPAHINPELGGEEDFRALAATLRAHEIGIILDIVPNHMAVGNADNPWWLDILSKGPASAYAGYFDIDWDAPGIEGKILAPFLGAPPAKALARGDLRLVRERGIEAFAYFEHRFPLRPQDQGEFHSGLAALLARQHFVLADWHEADARINWRRFFDITDLAALRANDPNVFEASHGKILSLYAQGLIQGVRVDHIDGIADPAAFCRLLRQRLEELRPGALIVVEKILADGETLPADWGVDGTTGYDFMNDVSALLHAPDGGWLENLWHRQSRRGLDFEQEEQAARREMLLGKFAAQRHAAVRALRRVLGGDGEEMDAALIAVIERLGCYRSYATGKPGSPGAGPFLAKAFARAAREQPDLKQAVRAMKDLFARADGEPAAVDAIRRVSQLAVPVAAKAVEDTAFYRYGRILSRNDVGFDPRRTTMTADEFHARAGARLSSPRALLATATHDHKRGEDARARLAALSHHPGAWAALVAASPDPAPVHPADAYHLYQTLLGAWPDEADEAFGKRIQGWCIKYLREAKLRSSWRAPDEAYEKTFQAFARALILEARGAGFRQKLQELLARIGARATANALIQLVLRNTVPGIADLYQGREFQDLSLVDPDNRRAVDFAARKAALASGSDEKQSALARLLAARRRDPALWAHGDYRPLFTEEANLLAFSRTHKSAHLVVLARLRDGAAPSSKLVLDCDHSELLSGRLIVRGERSLMEVLRDSPVSVLYAG